MSGAELGIAVKPYLEGCGYSESLLVAGLRFGSSEVPLTAFAHKPLDAGSACIAVITCDRDPASEILSYRSLGTPVFFVQHHQAFQWWSQETSAPKLLESLPLSEMPGFFDQHGRSLGPEAIYRAKTRGLFEVGYQLSFVDAGLMPLVEEEIGRQLSSLVERTVIDLRQSVSPGEISPEFGRWLFQSAFWLLAAKILQDKDVPGFKSVDLTDVDLVFSRVARHYGASLAHRLQDSANREGLRAAARTIQRFAALGHVTPEALGAVYENTLVSKEARENLGIHSTPAYLVNYIIWRLAPWIEEIPTSERQVFEPACGHAGFLVSAMRLLRDLHPVAGPKTMKDYLRFRLHGIDIDSFAIELARLSLTIADVPNPNGWDLQNEDMFLDTKLEDQARRATILLANPPFENFKPAERQKYEREGARLTNLNKTCVVLQRCLSVLPARAVFGVVIPQSILRSRDAQGIRSLLVRDFELEEICLFPDKVFTFSDMESAILVGRRRYGAVRKIRYRRVRDKDVEAFKLSYASTVDQEIPQERFAVTPGIVMDIPDLEEVWEACRHLPTLGTLATVDKGFEHRGDLPRTDKVFARHYFPGAVPGFVRLSRQLEIHGLPEEFWVNISPAVIRRPGAGTTLGVPQLLLNHARISRGPWRLKAMVDENGHAITGRFLAVRPRKQAVPLLYLWALLNSPFANGFAYAYSTTRDVLKKTIVALPVPRASSSDMARVAEAAQAYLSKVREGSGKHLSPDQDSRGLLLNLDAAILRLYDLQPRLERNLLDLFHGSPRLGVPFVFSEYFPADFEPTIPLELFLSEDFQRSTVDALRRRHKVVDSPEILSALRRAVEDFSE